MIVAPRLAMIVIKIRLAPSYLFALPEEACEIIGILKNDPLDLLPAPPCRTT